MTERTLITKGGDKSAKGKCLELKGTKLGSRLCMAPLQDVARVSCSCHGKRGGEGSVSLSVLICQEVKAPRD